MTTQATSANPAPRRLLADFPAASYEDWKAAATELLKGAPFEKALVTKTYEGFDLQPIYNASDLAALGLEGQLPGTGDRRRGQSATRAPWLISQELSAATPAAFNAVALRELEAGQEELNIWLDAPSRAGLDVDAAAAAHAGVCGLSLSSLADVRTALGGVFPEIISTYWRAGAAPAAVAALFAAWLQEKKADPAKVRGCIESDPLAYAVENGKLPASLDAAYDEMAALTRWASRYPGLQTVGVQGHVYHNGGASSAQELGAVLATAVAYLRALMARGVSPAEACSRVRLSLSVGPNYFIEIAKFRAARVLWNRVLEALGVPESARALHLHARTGLWNKTVYDPYVNMLRTTSEAFAAVVGGCDSLHVGAFDEIIRETDDFSRRIARNTHHILRDECDLKRVVDPAGGSYAVEVLTEQLGRSAWDFFQKIEAQGGMEAALRAGFVQAEVAKTSGAKGAALARRREVLVGTNQYPNATEKLLEPRASDAKAIRASRAEQVLRARPLSVPALAELAKLPAADPRRLELAATAAAAGATLGQITAAFRQGAAETLPQIPFRRGAEDFERLRTASAGWAAAHGTPPTILQVNLGPSRKYRIRADWTSAFFQVGGFRVLADRDFAKVEDAAAAAQASGASILVITSDDETYLTQVVPAAQALKAACPQARILVAGTPPPEQEAAWKEAGVQDYVNARAVCLDYLTALLKQLGVL